jgi:hypothetical protein
LISTPSGHGCERSASWPSTAARSASRALAKATKKESPLRVDLVAAVSGERLPEQPLVLAHDWAIAVPQLLHEARRPLDVREEERDGAGRRLGHGRERDTAIALMASTGRSRHSQRSTTG